MDNVDEKDASGAAALDLLPDELVVVILSWLHLADAAVLAQTCQRLWNIASHEVTRRLEHASAVYTTLSPSVWRNISRNPRDVVYVQHHLFPGWPLRLEVFPAKRATTTRTEQKTEFHYLSMLVCSAVANNDLTLIGATLERLQGNPCIASCSFYDIFGSCISSVSRLPPQKMHQEAFRVVFCDKRSPLALSNPRKHFPLTTALFEGQWDIASMVFDFLFGHEADEMRGARLPGVLQLAVYRDNHLGTWNDDKIEPRGNQESDGDTTNTADEEHAMSVLGWFNRQGWFRSRSADRTRPVGPFVCPLPPVTYYLLDVVTLLEANNFRGRKCVNRATAKDVQDMLEMAWASRPGPTPPESNARRTFLHQVASFLAGTLPEAHSCSLFHKLDTVQCGDMVFDVAAQFLIDKADKDYDFDLETAFHQAAWTNKRLGGRLAAERALAILKGAPV